MLYSFGKLKNRQYFTIYEASVTSVSKHDQEIPREKFQGNFSHEHIDQDS